MKYGQLKEALLELFDIDKLSTLPGEWGFFNELDRVVTRVGYATNLSPHIIREAARNQVDLLLTHHDSWDFVYGLKPRCNQMLEAAGITHAFFHAPLDDADFGTSASLAKALGVTGGKKVMPYAEIYYGGVAGEIEPADFAAFAGRLTGILEEDIRCYQNHGNLIQKVAVAAGGGNMTTEMRIAAEQGCDTYVTGEYVLYSQQYAELMGMNLFVGSHTRTEILGVRSMAERVCGNTDIQLIRLTEPNY